MAMPTGSRPGSSHLTNKPAPLTPETIPGTGRLDEGTRPDQAQGRSVENGSQDGAEVQGGRDAARQELDQLREQMAVIKQEVAVEVDRTWVSPWRTQQVFDLKVQTRLTGNQEYRSLQNRVRCAEAGLASESDVATKARTAK